MTKQTRFRGAVSVRAESTDPAVMVNKIQAAFEALKTENDKALADIRKDVVQSEKIERINAEITTLQATLDDTNAKLAAMQVNGTGNGLSAKQAEHKAVFADFFHGKVEAKATTYSDPDGGFLVPTQVEAGVTRVLGQALAMRRLAQVMNITGGSYVKHKSLGGATSGWVGETESNNTSRAETSTPTLSRMEFTPGEIYAEPYATQQGLDDIADVEAWLASEVGVEFMEEEGAAFISGNGVKKPRGFLSYDQVLNASYAWGKVGYTKTGGAAAFAASAPADALISLIHSLKSGYRNNATFLMNDLTLAAVRKFKDGQGNYAWQPSLQVGAPSTLLGYAVETDDNMPDLGANNFPLAFADWKQAYLIVDRTGIRVLRNPFKVNGLVAFYTTKRVGGGIQNFEAIKTLKCEA